MRDECMFPCSPRASSARWCQNKDEENGHTLMAATNYAIALVEMQRFKEAKPLMRKTIPVVRRVLALCRKESLAEHDKLGDTPLTRLLRVGEGYDFEFTRLVKVLLERHAACAKTPRRIETDIFANPRNRVGGEYPIHDVAMYNHTKLTMMEVLRAWPEGAMARDGQDFLPLHHAVAGQAKRATLKELLDAYPGAAATADPGGTYPIHAVMRIGRPLDAVQLFIDANAGCERQVDAGGDTPLLASLRGGVIPWRVGAALLRRGSRSVEETS